MKVAILAPEKQIFTGEAVAVTVPSVNGSFTALENHAPIVSLLEKGEILVETSDSEEKLRFPVSGGFVEISDNGVTACVDQNEKQE
ncbi:MAG: F0F1 ATP synthase subunit epsilon [Paludibacteraceae bacterium]|nr:F0F1 ATP synthase subunit epsilon [Paludibacteraceae bacterium]